MLLMLVAQYLLTRGTVATKATTGFTIVSNKGYDLYMFCAQTLIKLLGE
jgi:hypothetical protein